jgi:hypothetical protein
VVDFVIGLGGFVNPDGHLPCGTNDPKALLPEPVHTGGCKECASHIKALLVARRDGTKPPKQREEQIAFPWAPGPKKVRD